MIERHWKGTAKTENAASYIQHLLDETFPQLSSINGFKKASVLKSIAATAVEFLVITTWDSMDAIREFAGDNPEIAVVPLKVQEMMISFDQKVSHYEVVLDYDPLNS
ncbi:MAG: hypothetical protein ABI480_10280 [Chitinophagaceae bacterium]